MRARFIPLQPPSPLIRGGFPGQSCPSLLLSLPGWVLAIRPHRTLRAGSGPASGDSQVQGVGSCIFIFGINVQNRPACFPLVFQCQSLFCQI